MNPIEKQNVVLFIEHTIIDITQVIKFNNPSSKCNTPVIRNSVVKERLYMITYLKIYGTATLTSNERYEYDLQKFTVAH